MSCTTATSTGSTSSAPRSARRSGPPRAGRTAVGQPGGRYGQIAAFNNGYAGIYQGVWLTPGTYTFTASTQSSWAAIRLFSIRASTIGAHGQHVVPPHGLADAHDQLHRDDGRHLPPGNRQPQRIVLRGIDSGVLTKTS